MRIDFAATQRHFIDHLAPVYKELGNDAGDFYVLPLPDLANHRERHGMTLTALQPPRFVEGSTGAAIQKQHPFYGVRLPANDDRPVVMAAIGEASLVEGQPRKLGLLEHGCGLSFVERDDANPGGGGKRDRFSLFLMPGERAAQLDREAHPKAMVAVVGCPKLDKWHGGLLKRTWHNPGNPTVALTFHFDADTCPETRGTWEEFKEALPDVKERFGDVLGHAHPRCYEELAPQYEVMGIEPVKEWEEVCERADVLCGDAGSAPYEFAALGKPVVVRNGEDYRRDVHHGLRFWESIPGIQCDDPSQLAHTIELALEDPWSEQVCRGIAVEAAYGKLDGRASKRAADAIREWAVTQ